MTDLAPDLRYAVRALRRRPGFAVAAILTLALGIGASTTIFSVVRGALLRPLPYPEPDRLVALWETNADWGWEQANSAPANFLDWRERVTAFEDVTAHLGWGGVTLGDDVTEPEFIRSAWVFGNFFDVLGVPPALGRGFQVEESWDGRDLVAVVSHGLWLRRFAGDPGVIGRTIRVDGTNRLVVGVAAEGFGYPTADVDVWLPVGWQAANRTAVWFRRAHFVRPVARLRPGVTVEQAGTALAGVARELEREYPETNRGMGAGLTDLRQSIVGDATRYLLVAFGAVTLLLLIACVNVANLFLVRVADRRHELAIRAALGAPRRRLGGLLLLESLTIAMAGGALGIALGAWGTELFLAVAIPDVPRLSAVRMDPLVLGYAVVVTLATTLLFGAGPALLGADASATAALAESGRGTSAGKRAALLRRGLIVAESALAVLLVAGAGLMLRTLQELGRVDPGFDPTGVLTATLQLPGGTYQQGADVTAFQRELLAKLQSVPGVTAAGGTDGLPLEGTAWTSDLAIEGEPPLDRAPDFNRRVVTAGYFEALRVPVLAGRLFTDADDAAAPGVALINETLARRHFGDRDPIGRRIAFDQRPDADEPWYTVVGVVGAEKLDGLSSARDWPEVFLSASQTPRWRLSLVLRSALTPEQLVTALRATLRATDPQLALADVRTMGQVMGDSIARERFVAVLLGTFAALALLLAAVGVYGVVAYTVAQREREVGVRVALGASRGEIVRLVLRQGMGTVGIGLAAGLVMVIPTTRVMRGLLFGIEPTDPLTLAAVVTVLGATAALACYVPARHAARIPPMEALRHE
jgi:putative ABC transport system permease protein